MGDTTRAALRQVPQSSRSNRQRLDSDGASDWIETLSSSNQLGFTSYAWLENVDGFPLPLIQRELVPYTPYHVITQKILNYFRTVFSQELFDCIPFDHFHMIKMNYKEAQEFNRIMNNYSLDPSSIDYHIFKSEELLVSFDRVREIVTFLNTCRDLIINNIKENQLFGFILIDKQYEIPFVWQDRKQLVPLCFFENEYLNTCAKDLQDPWQFGYLQLCCKIQNISEKYFNQYPLKVVELVNVKTHFPSGTSFDLFVPVINQRLLAPADRVAEEHYDLVPNEDGGELQNKLSLINGLHGAASEEAFQLQPYLPNNFNSSLQASLASVDQSVKIQHGTHDIGFEQEENHVNTLNTNFTVNVMYPTTSIQRPDNNHSETVVVELQTNFSTGLCQDVQTNVSSAQSHSAIQITSDIQENNLKYVNKQHEKEMEDGTVSTSDLLLQTNCATRTVQSSIPTNKIGYRRSLSLKRKNNLLDSIHVTSVPESTISQNISVIEKSHNDILTHEKPFSPLHTNSTRLNVQDAVETHDHNNCNLQENLSYEIYDSRQNNLPTMRDKLDPTLCFKSRSARTNSMNNENVMTSDEKSLRIEWKTLQNNLNAKLQRTKEHLRKVLNMYSSAQNPIQERNRQKLRKQIKELQKELVIDPPKTRKRRKDRLKINLKDQTVSIELDENCADPQQHDEGLNDGTEMTKDLPYQSDSKMEEMQPSISASQPKCKRNLSLKRKNKTGGLQSANNIACLNEQNAVDFNKDVLSGQAENSDDVGQVNINTATPTSIINTTKSKSDLCASNPGSKINTDHLDKGSDQETLPIAEKIEHMVYKLDPDDILLSFSKEGNDSCNHNNLLASKSFTETMSDRAQLQYPINTHVLDKYNENKTKKEREIMENIQNTLRVEREKRRMEDSKISNKTKYRKPTIADQNSNNKQSDSESINLMIQSVQVDTINRPEYLQGQLKGNNSDSLLHYQKNSQYNISTTPKGAESGSSVQNFILTPDISHHRCITKKSSEHVGKKINNPVSVTTCTVEFTMEVPLSNSSQYQLTDNFNWLAKNKINERDAQQEAQLFVEQQSFDPRNATISKEVVKNIDKSFLKKSKLKTNSDLANTIPVTHISRLQQFNPLERQQMSSNNSEYPSEFLKGNVDITITPIKRPTNSFPTTKTPKNVSEIIPTSLPSQVNNKSFQQDSFTLDCYPQPSVATTNISLKKKKTRKRKVPKIQENCSLCDIIGSNSLTSNRQQFESAIYNHNKYRGKMREISKAKCFVSKNEGKVQKRQKKQNGIDNAHDISTNYLPITTHATFPSLHFPSATVSSMQEPNFSPFSVPIGIPSELSSSRNLANSATMSRSPNIRVPTSGNSTEPLTLSEGSTMDPSLPAFVPPFNDSISQNKNVSPKILTRGSIASTINPVCGSTCVPLSKDLVTKNRNFSSKVTSQINTTNSQKNTELLTVSGGSIMSPSVTASVSSFYDLVPQNANFVPNISKVPQLQRPNLQYQPRSATFSRGSTRDSWAPSSTPKTNDLVTKAAIDQIMWNSNIEPNLMSSLQLENFRKGIEQYMHRQYELMAYQQGYSDAQRQLHNHYQVYQNTPTSRSTVSDQFPYQDRNR